MRRVFVSYSRQDEIRILPVVHALEIEGFSVFRDNRIKVREGWRARLDLEIVEADALIVLWSVSSIARPEVLREVALALEHGKTVVHCLIDTGVQPPAEYSHQNAANLTLWTGRDRDFDHWRQICAELSGSDHVNPAPKKNSAPSENQLISSNEIVNCFDDAKALTRELRRALRDGYKVQKVLNNALVLRKIPRKSDFWVGRFTRRIIGGPTARAISESAESNKSLILQIGSSK